jgi:hypothetical protein
MKFLCVSCDKQMRMVERTTSESGELSLIFECRACQQRVAMLNNLEESKLMRSVEAPSGQLTWTAGAQRRLEKIPAFIRPMALSGIERFARENGHSEVDEALLDRARKEYGM